jgi:hypothetical protein
VRTDGVAASPTAVWATWPGVGPGRPATAGTATTAVAVAVKVGERRTSSRVATSTARPTTAATHHGRARSASLHSAHGTASP